MHGPLLASSYAGWNAMGAARIWLAYLSETGPKAANSGYWLRFPIKYKEIFIF